MPFKTLVLGASPKPERYSFKAVNKLVKYGHPVIALGVREAMIGDTKIHIGMPKIDHVDSVTMYLDPQNQIGFYNYILNLKPRRIIFNPGTYNPELIKLAMEKGIEIIEQCTLVLLSSGKF